MTIEEVKRAMEIVQVALAPMNKSFRELVSDYQLKRLANISAEIDRAIEAEQIERWRSDPLQILATIADLTGLRWRRGPIGAWNGRRVVGVRMQFKVRFSYWRWIPLYSRFSSWILWLCLGIYFEWEYGDFVEDDREY